MFSSLDGSFGYTNNYYMMDGGVQFGNTSIGTLEQFGDKGFYY
jgi:hypothetical protein